MGVFPHSFSVQVPATSANIGPGFDSFGIALSLSNRFEVALSEVDQQVWSTKSAFAAPDFNLNPGKSLFFKAMQAWYDCQGVLRPPCTVSIEAHIPLTRGLGSSSSVIVGGLLAAATQLQQLSPEGGGPATPELQQTLMDLATRLEGHPDNVVPALLGGIGFCDEDEEHTQVKYYRLPWPVDWRVVIVIPESPLLTETARQVLPPQVRYADAIFNLRKAALLTWALEHADSQAMADALCDRLHQPYRRSLIPLFDPVREAAQGTQAIGTVISGAGPSIAIIYEASKETVLFQQLNACLNENAAHPATLCPLSVSTHGASVLC